MNKCQRKQQIIEIEKNLDNQFIRHGLTTALFKIVKKINGNFGREWLKNCKWNQIKILHLKNMTKFIQSSVNVLNNRLVTTEERQCELSEKWRDYPRLSRHKEMEKHIPPQKGVKVRRYNIRIVRTPKREEEE